MDLLPPNLFKGASNEILELIKSFILPEWAKIEEPTQELEIIAHVKQAAFFVSEIESGKEVEIHTTGAGPCVVIGIGCKNEKSSIIALAHVDSSTSMYARALNEALGCFKNTGAKAWIAGGAQLADSEKDIAGGDLTFKRVSLLVKRLNIKNVETYNTGKQKFQLPGTSSISAKIFVTKPGQILFNTWEEDSCRCADEKKLAKDKSLANTLKKPIQQPYNKASCKKYCGFDPCILEKPAEIKLDPADTNEEYIRKTYKETREGNWESMMPCLASPSHRRRRLENIKDFLSKYNYPYYGDASSLNINMSKKEIEEKLSKKSEPDYNGQDYLSYKKDRIKKGTAKTKETIIAHNAPRFERCAEAQEIVSIETKGL